MNRTRNPIWTKSPKRFKGYSRLRRKIHQTRRELVRDIMQAVKPHMWDTGYCKDFELGKPTQYLKAFFFKFSDKQKEDGTDHYNVGTITVIGFTEQDAVATDAHAGGLATQELGALPIEELFNLHAWVMRRKEFF